MMQTAHVPPTCPRMTRQDHACTAHSDNMAPFKKYLQFKCACSLQTAPFAQADMAVHGIFDLISRFSMTQLILRYPTLFIFRGRLQFIILKIKSTFAFSQIDSILFHVLHQTNNYTRILHKIIFGQMCKKMKAKCDIWEQRK